MTARLDRKDIVADRDRADSTEKADAADPMDSSDANEPIDPIDRADPTDPIDRTDPLEATHRSESSDHRDQSDVRFCLVIQPSLVEQPASRPTTGIASELRLSKQIVRLLGCAFEDGITRQIGGHVDDLREVQLSAGMVRYRDSGQGKVVVFVHGLGVNGSLWRKVVPALESSYRCVVPDWPLGSHTVAMKPDADITPRGVARLIAEFLEALDLQNVTVVANDTGGALAQLLVTQDPERVGRLVLTPCDAMENFLPKQFRFLQWIARVPGSFFLLYQPLRIAALRRLPLAFGLLSKRPVPRSVTDGWVRPMITDRDVRRDTARFLRAIDPRDTLDAAARLGNFDGPILLAWSTEDRVFPLSGAKRLAAAASRASIVEIPDSYCFVPEDQPERLATLIRDFAADGSAGEAVDDNGEA